MSLPVLRAHRWNSVMDSGTPLQRGVAALGPCCPSAQSSGRAVFSNKTFCFPQNILAFSSSCSPISINFFYTVDFFLKQQNGRDLIF